MNNEGWIEYVGQELPERVEVQCRFDTNDIIRFRELISIYEAEELIRDAMPSEDTAEAFILRWRAKRNAKI